MTPFRVKPTVMDATMFMVQKIADSHLNQSVRAPTFGGGGATSINPASLRRSLLFRIFFLKLLLGRQSVASCVGRGLVREQSLRGVA